MENGSPVDLVKNDIIKNYQPSKIIVFSQKTNLDDEILSFKLCIVIDTADKYTIEKEIYLSIDSEVPFDVIIYTTSEWQFLVQQEDSFAAKLCKMGIVIYEQIWS